MSSEICPVPIEQQPLEEYKEISKSWFFSLPKNKGLHLYRSLAISWLITFPINLLLCYNSYSINNDVIKVFFTSAIVSLGLPIILLIRLLIGWNYIWKRLTVKKVEYEESGWYDGNYWNKPEKWHQKDMLVAKYQVGPIIRNIINPLIISLLLLLTGTLFCQLLSS